MDKTIFRSYTHEYPNGIDSVWVYGHGMLFDGKSFSPEQLAKMPYSVYN